MNTYSLTHPSGAEYELDWHDDNTAPSNDQLGQILDAHTGMPPVGQDASNTPNTAQANVNNVRLAVGSDTSAPRLQLASGGQQNPTLVPYAQSILDRYDKAEVEPNDSTLPTEMRRFRPTLVGILGQYGTMDQIRRAPPNIRAALYALTQLGDTAYGYDGTVTDPQLPGFDPESWKCNVFASKCWARGAGINYNTNGQYPAGYP